MAGFPLLQRPIGPFGTSALRRLETFDRWRCPGYVEPRRRRIAAEQPLDRAQFHRPRARELSSKGRGIIRVLRPRLFQSIGIANWERGRNKLQRGTVLSAYRSPVMARSSHRYQATGSSLLPPGGRAHPIGNSARFVALAAHSLTGCPAETDIAAMTLDTRRAAARNFGSWPTRRETIAALAGEFLAALFNLASDCTR